MMLGISEIFRWIPCWIDSNPFARSGSELKVVGQRWVEKCSLKKQGVTEVIGTILMQNRRIFNQNISLHY